MAPIDCLIVGGGPAGLTGAIYAARYHLNVQVIDAGGGRAALIPCTHNHAGFPQGVSGRDLLSRMRRQAEKYGAVVSRGRVERLTRRGDDFLAETATTQILARTVLLATGVTNRRPQMPPELHDAAVTQGRLRYCPVCDGFEVTDQDVAVIGTGAHAVQEALFLRSYTARVTLIAPDERHDLTDEEREALLKAGIRAADGSPAVFELDSSGLALSFAGERKRFDAVYPALGTVVHSDLAQGVGAATTADGCIEVDAHQRTTVSGLYAAGDVVPGLDQISFAMGGAAVACTAIRNDLAKRRPLLRTG